MDYFKPIVILSLSTILWPLAESIAIADEVDRDALHIVTSAFRSNYDRIHDLHAKWDELITNPQYFIEELEDAPEKPATFTIPRRALLEYELWISGDQVRHTTVTPSQTHHVLIKNGVITTYIPKDYAAIQKLPDDGEYPMLYSVHRNFGFMPGEHAYLDLLSGRELKEVRFAETIGETSFVTIRGDLRTENEIEILCSSEYSYLPVHVACTNAAGNYNYYAKLEYDNHGTKMDPLWFPSKVVSLYAIREKIDSLDDKRWNSDIVARTISDIKEVTINHEIEPSVFRMPTFVTGTRINDSIRNVFYVQGESMPLVNEDKSGDAIRRVFLGLTVAVILVLVILVVKKRNTNQPVN